MQKRTANRHQIRMSSVICRLDHRWLTCVWITQNILTLDHHVLWEWMGWSFSKRMGLSINLLGRRNRKSGVSRQAGPGLEWGSGYCLSLGPHVCWSWALGRADMVEGPSLQGRKMALWDDGGLGDGHEAACRDPLKGAWIGARASECGHMSKVAHYSPCWAALPAFLKLGCSLCSHSGELWEGSGPQGSTRQDQR